ncbi:MAG: thrombospondin type 3 repeat-containing protein [Myxococcales bacterium]|nr:thrombospondin type 3 repeat-containing protein [Myxococcales bacterium]
MLSRSLAIVVLATACPRDPPTNTETDPLVDTSDTGTDTTDTDTPTTTTTTPTTTDWTIGPALPDCTPVPSNSDTVVLSGVVLTPKGPIAGEVVYDRSTGLVTCVSEDCGETDAEVICTEGVISPALINTHDHTQFGVVGPWRHADLYGDRYGWQSDGRYFDFREAYDGMIDDWFCESVKWAELRMIVSGSTSVAGSAGDQCIEVLARNLDEGFGAHGIPSYDLSFNSGRVTNLDEGDAAALVDDLASGRLEASLHHVAEGVDGRVRNEIDWMFGIGAVGPGEMFIHATDATTGQLAQMASTTTGIVWSPRSNLDLYGGTTPADVADRVGVPVILGPDWTWSGSNRVTAELQCAMDYLSARDSDLSDQDVFDWVTLDAAVMLGLQGQLGMLVPDAQADISVFPFSRQPYRSVIEAGYDDVKLVIIAGDARYGEPDWVTELNASPLRCESVTACSVERTLCVEEGFTGSDLQTYSELEASLSSALAMTSMPPDLQYAGELYPLWACDEVRPSCDVSAPVVGDDDGDGVDDASDLCPAAYDPLQNDHDGDGVGDACDDCPLTPEPSCTFDPDDIDEDGIANDLDVCPWDHDPKQEDGDKDGKGDLCDLCPAYANPGDAGCRFSIRQIRDVNEPGHPSVGTEVEVSGVVVTGVRSNGFFIQDPKEADFGALYVFSGGAPGVNQGELVTVEGTYEEYFEQTEITNPTVTVDGTAPEPAPIAVADPCTVGTGGVDAERYESMLVTVSKVEVTDANPDAPSDFNEFEVAGCLRVDDLLCATCWTDQPAVGFSYASITGPLAYTFANTKVAPRSPKDFTF